MVIGRAFGWSSAPARGFVEGCPSRRALTISGFLVMLNHPFGPIRPVFPLSKLQCLRNRSFMMSASCNVWPYSGHGGSNWLLKATLVESRTRCHYFPPLFSTSDATIELKLASQFCWRWSSIWLPARVHTASWWCHLSGYWSGIMLCLAVPSSRYGPMTYRRLYLWVAFGTL